MNKTGPKPKPVDQLRVNHVVTNLKADEAEAVYRLADYHDVSVSALVRRAVLAYIKTEQQNKP